MKGRKELEEVLIKKLFEYKLSVGKCLLILNWADLAITTVDSLVSIHPLQNDKEIRGFFFILFHKV